MLLEDCDGENALPAFDDMGHGALATDSALQYAAGAGGGGRGGGPRVEAVGDGGMTRLYLIRHAEAEGNLYRVAHGHCNGLITNYRGYQQIDALRERFRKVDIDAVYSSDLYRTQITARAIWLPKARRCIWSRRSGRSAWGSGGPHLA